MSLISFNPASSYQVIKSLDDLLQGMRERHSDDN